MQRPTVKNAISLFFLASFLLLRVGNLHAATHAFSDDDVQHCELCDLMARSNEATALHMATTFAGVPHHNEPEYDGRNAFLNYTSPKVQQPYFLYFFNKPPPTPILG